MNRFAGALFLALVVGSGLILTWRSSSGPESRGNGGDSSASHSTKLPRDSGRENQLPVRPKTARPDVLARFTADKQQQFYADHSEIVGSYKRKGLLAFYTVMRNALKGDPEALAEVFETYAPGAADTEGFSDYAVVLIDNLGDRYFAEQLRKQPPEIQRLIVNQLWIARERGLTEDDGSDRIPLSDRGSHYPATGSLLLELEARNTDAQ